MGAEPFGFQAWGMICMTTGRIPPENVPYIFYNDSGISVCKNESKRSSCTVSGAPNSSKAWRARREGERPTTKGQKVFHALFQFSILRLSEPVLEAGLAPFLQPHSAPLFDPACEWRYEPSLLHFRFSPH
jgi:hypothetical protein